jgi:hypothetical protein
VSGDDYIRRIGLATENEAKAALYLFLVKEYEGERLDVDETDLNFVLQAVRNSELASPSTPEAARAFAAENRQLVRYHVRSLGINERTPVYGFLYEQYVKNVGLAQADAAAALAAAVANKVFAEEPNGDDGQAFAEENEEFIEVRARKLGSDDELCAILSGAAYNTSYARYVTAGGSRGMFSNRFLTYIRAKSGLYRGDASLAALSGRLAAEIPHDLGSNVLAPVQSMFTLDIFRPLPHNPNERQFYEAVHQFAIKVGLPFRG